MLFNFLFLRIEYIKRYCIMNKTNTTIILKNFQILCYMYNNSLNHKLNFKVLLLLKIIYNFYRAIFKVKLLIVLFSFHVEFTSHFRH